MPRRRERHPPPAPTSVREEPRQRRERAQHRARHQRLAEAQQPERGVHHVEDHPLQRRDRGRVPGDAERDSADRQRLEAVGLPALQAERRRRADSGDEQEAQMEGHREPAVDECNAMRLRVRVEHEEAVRDEARQPDEGEEEGERRPPADELRASLLGPRRVDPHAPEATCDRASSQGGRESGAGPASRSRGRATHRGFTPAARGPAESSTSSTSRGAPSPAGAPAKPAAFEPGTATRADRAPRASPSSHALRVDFVP
jgi:hypothetical protein